METVATPKATTKVLTTEESPELQATSTVPTNHEARTIRQRLSTRHLLFFELMASPGVPMIMHTWRTRVRNLSNDLDDSYARVEHHSVCLRRVTMVPIVDPSPSRQRGESSALASSTAGDHRRTQLPDSTLALQSKFRPRNTALLSRCTILTNTYTPLLTIQHQLSPLLAFPPTLSFDLISLLFTFLHTTFLLVLASKVLV